MQHQNHMTLDYYNDFYYLEALRVDIARKIGENPENEFRHSIARLKEDVDELFETVAHNLAYRTFVYIWCACLGEARHASDTMAAEIFIKQLNEYQQRGDVFAVARKFPPTPQNIETVIQVFSGKWRGSFGGKAWKRIAESLRFYQKDPTTFIDHVIDLQHNTGTVFNKGESKYHIAFNCEYDGDLMHFLSYKAQQDILTTPYFDYTILVSKEVYDLVMRHNVIFHRKIVTKWIKASFRTLPDFTIKWGRSTLTTDKKWNEWSNVRGGNKPSAVDIVNTVRNELRKHLWMSEAELTAMAKNMIAQYKHKTPAQILRTVNIKYLKEQNAKKIAMLPCTAKFDSDRVYCGTFMGTYKFYTEMRNTEKLENCYLYQKKSVIYLVTESAEIAMITRGGVDYLQNLEEG